MLNPRVIKSADQDIEIRRRVIASIFQSEGLLSTAFMALGPHLGIATLIKDLNLPPHPEASLLLLKKEVDIPFYSLVIAIRCADDALIIPLTGDPNGEYILVSQSPLTGEPPSEEFFEFITSNNIKIN